MKFVISGGAGFIGAHLVKKLTVDGHGVTVIDLCPPRFDGFSEEQKNLVRFHKADLTKTLDLTEVLEGADSVIHLAGASIFKRWTPAYKKEIVESRVRGATSIIEAIKRCDKKPAVLVSASAVGYYGDRGEEELTEESPPGDDFLAKVCIALENAILPARAFGLRTVSVRTGIVLGPGGMLDILVPLYKKFLGGRLGSGAQWFSWIHLADLLSVYLLASTDRTLEGAVNGVASHPVRNREFVKALGAALGRPAFWAVPKFALRLALGEFGNSTLMSQKVLPKKLVQAGFRFSYPNISPALEEVIAKCYNI